MRKLLTAAAAALVILWACAGDPGGGPHGSPDASAGGEDAGVDAGPPWNYFPKTVSAAGVLQFLNQNPHHAGGWVYDSATPRPNGPASPHGWVRVYFNPALQASIAAGHGAWDGGVRVGGPHDPGSMAVKEMFDVTAVTDGGQAPIVARAAMMKTDAGDALTAWTYFCIGRSDLCANEPTTDTKAAFGNGAMLFSCQSCHNGNVFTKMP